MLCFTKAIVCGNLKPLDIFLLIGHQSALPVLLHRRVAILRFWAPRVCKFRDGCQSIRLIDRNSIAKLAHRRKFQLPLDAPGMRQLLHGFDEPAAPNLGGCEIGWLFVLGDEIQVLESSRVWALGIC